MKRMKTTSVLVAVAILLLSAQSNVWADSGTSATAVIIPGGISGKWTGKGVDTRGVKWDMTYTLSQKDGVITGYTSWTGSDGSSSTGKVEGTVNFANKTLTLKDLPLDTAQGNVMLAVYTGTLNADFTKMSVKWTIPEGGSPGSFEATKGK
jgi:hypothetical protein